MRNGATDGAGRELGSKGKCGNLQVSGRPGAQEGDSDHQGPEMKVWMVQGTPGGCSSHAAVHGSFHRNPSGWLVGGCCHG